MSSTAPALSTLQPSSSTRKRAASEAPATATHPDTKRTKVEEPIANSSRVSSTKTEISYKSESSSDIDKKKRKKKKLPLSATESERVEQEEDAEEDKLSLVSLQKDKEDISPADSPSTASSSTLSAPYSPLEPIENTMQALPSGNPEPSLTQQDVTETSTDPSSTRPTALAPHDAKDLAAHRTLLTTMLPSLTCQICLLLMHRPFMLSPCGHAACYECLVTWFSNDPGQPVPHNPPTPAGGGGAEGANGAAPAPAAPSAPFPGLPVVKRRKTCPHCRALVQERPIEAWAIKDMVSVVVKSGLAEEDSIPSKLKEASSSSGTGSVTPNANTDPWTNIFPSKAAVNRERERTQRMRERERFGIEDEEDGVWRCVECAAEIWNGSCTGCGAAYSGHIGFNPFPDFDEDEEMSDYSDGLYNDDFEHPVVNFIHGLMRVGRNAGGWGHEDDDEDIPMGMFGGSDDDEEVDEDEGSYEGSFIDDEDVDRDADLGSEASWAPREPIPRGSNDNPVQALYDEHEDEGAPVVRRPRSHGVHSRSRRVIASDDEEEEPTAAPRIISQSGRQIVASVDEDEEDGEMDLAARVAQLERDMYGDDGSVFHSHRSQYMSADDPEDEVSAGSDHSVYEAYSFADEGYVHCTDDEDVYSNDGDGYDDEF